MASRAMDDLERLIKKGSFGTRTVDDSARFRTVQIVGGQREVTKRFSQQQRELFALCLEPIARSTTVLGRSRSGCVVDVTNYNAKTRSQITNGPRCKVVVLGPELNKCDADSPGYRIWGPYGTLQPLAIVLEAGYGNDNYFAVELSIFLPVWGADHHRVQPGECAVLRFDLAGACRATRYRPYIQKGEDPELLDSDRILRHLLGLTSSPMRMVEELSTADRCVGFPGVETYLATVLPSLSAYFVALAQSADE